MVMLVMVVAAGDGWMDLGMGVAVGRGEETKEQASGMRPSKAWMAWMGGQPDDEGGWDGRG